MLASGTRKNFRFFLRSSLFTECEPVFKLITEFHLPALSMYHITEGASKGCVSIADIRLYSRMQNTTHLFPTGGRTAIPSGLILQNLSFAIVSLDWSSWNLFGFLPCEGTIHLAGSCCIPYRILRDI
jgi:hypothetical protein